MADAVKTFDKAVDGTLQKIVSPSVVKGFIHLLLTLYAVRLAPELPRAITDLFTNQYFRLLIFSLILWIARYSPSTAILMSLAFMITVNYATNKPLWEFLENIESVSVQQPIAEPVPVDNMPLQESVPMTTVQPSEQDMVSGAPMAAETPVAQGAVMPAEKDSGCYPIRRYDMSQVVGYEM